MLNHGLGQAWRRGRFVPGLPFQPVAQELLVVARWVAPLGQALRIRLLRPEARGIGRQHLVHQHHLARSVQAKLELGVRDDDALGCCDFASGNIKLDADLAHLVRQIGADGLLHLREADVFVVLAHSCLGGRGEDRLWQQAGVVQPWRQGHAAHRLALLVFLPATARQVAPHHSLDRQGLEAFDEHGTPGHLGHFVGTDHALRRVAGQVVGANVAELVKPEQGHLREQCALAGDSLAHDHVERADAVTGHHQNAVVAHGVVVTDFAASQQGKGREGGRVKGGAHAGVEKRGGDEELRLLYDLCQLACRVLACDHLKRVAFDLATLAFATKLHVALLAKRFRGFAGGFEPFASVKFFGVFDQKLAHRTGHGEADIGVDVDLSDAEFDRFLNFFNGYAVGFFHVTTVLVDDRQQILRHAARAVHDQVRVG